MRKRAFTLLEIICAISLSIVVFLQIFNISHMVITQSEKTKKNILLNQTASDIEAYIKNALSAPNISLDSVDEENKSISFRVFYTIGDNTNCIIANKKLYFNKNTSKLMISTTNEYYRLIGSEYVAYRNTTGGNIVAENIKDISINMEDKKLSFHIIVSMKYMDTTLDFYVKNLEQKNFI